ncbi:MAG: ribosome recycling factor [Saprospiraceae bacterium]
MEDLELKLEEANIMMDSAIEHLQHELVKLRTGKASPALLQDISVDYYGAPTPLQQVANIQTSDARTLTIQPWEKSILSAIERALINANLGVTPANDGEIIRLSIPVPTEERRLELVKRAKAEGEKAKVSIRQDRHKAMEEIKKAVKDGLPEDLGKRKEADVQKAVDEHIKNVDFIVAKKENEIMTI